MTSIPAALMFPLTVIQQTDVNATLGADSLHKSLLAGLIGIACVAFFMIAYYRLPGAGGHSCPGNLCGDYIGNF